MNWNCCRRELSRTWRNLGLTGGSDRLDSGSTSSRLAAEILNLCSVVNRCQIDVGGFRDLTDVDVRYGDVSRDGSCDPLAATAQLDRYLQ